MEKQAGLMTHETCKLHEILNQLTKLISCINFKSIEGNNWRKNIKLGVSFDFLLGFYTGQSEYPTYQAVSTSIKNEELQHTQNPNQVYWWY